MTERLLPNVITYCSPADLYVKLRDSWPPDSSPTRASVLTLLAHWALETGFGHACHCWNLGNAKHVSGDGYDFTQFACGEEMGLAVAQNAVAVNPSQVQIVSTYVGANGAEMASVRFLPPHPATSFLAFDTLDAGAAYYLTLLRGRFRSAWPAVVAGDVAGFCHLLKLAGYYTADEHAYTSGVLRCYHALDTTIPIDGAIGTQAAVDEGIDISIHDQETDPPPPDAT